MAEIGQTLKEQVDAFQAEVEKQLEILEKRSEEAFRRWIEEEHPERENKPLPFYAAETDPTSEEESEIPSSLAGEEKLPQDSC